MSILGRLALLFVLVPLIELVLLIELGRFLGVWPTIGVVVVTGAGGALLARAAGVRTLRNFRVELARGQLPGQAIWDGLAILLGGAFLLTPGLLTDFVGFSLLVPGTRRILQRWGAKTLGAGSSRGRDPLHRLRPPPDAWGSPRAWPRGWRRPDGAIPG